MDKRQFEKEERFMDTIKDTYLTFIEFIENPERAGAVGILTKIKPYAKDLVKSKLMDSWCKTDKDLRKALTRMRRVMGYFDID